MLAENAYRQLQGIELSSTKLPVHKRIQLLVAGPMLYDGSEGHFKKEDIKGRHTEVKQFMKHPTAAKVVEVRNPILPIDIDILLAFRSCVKTWGKPLTSREVWRLKFPEAAVY